MVLVDTSVWVDYLRGHATWQVRALKDLLSGEEIIDRGRLPEGEGLGARG